MRRLVKVSTVFLLALAAVLACLLSASIYTYARLTAETPIARVSFTPEGQERYLAHLRTGDRCEDRVLRVFGDQWRIDAEFLKWAYFASVLGFDSLYRLDRFQGRYSRIEDENSKPLLAYDLGRDTTVDVAAIAASLGGWNFLVDASYGSSTYQEIDADRVFYVFKTTTGIITRSLPEGPAEEQLAAELARSCTAGAGPWRRFTAWVDSAMRRLIA
jgi:hypothetical protein